MSQLPCDVHGQTVRGKLCGVYPALLQNGSRRSRKLKVCPDCCRELLLRHSVDWCDKVLFNHTDRDPVCTACGLVPQSEADLARFYVTLYLDGSNRRDYVAWYCDSCAAERVKEFSLAAA